MHSRPIPYALIRIAAIALGIAVSAHAQTPKTAIELAYEPSRREVTLTLPEAITPDLEALTPPAWLERRNALSDEDPGSGQVVFTGILPEIGTGDPNLGAGNSGAFLFGALRWLPAVPGAPPSEIRIRTPRSHRGIATGELISELATEGSYTATFRMAEGWQEADVFLGPYEVGESVLDLAHGEVIVRTYFKPAEQEYAQDYLDAAGRYITRYSRDIGPYPYPGFAVVSAPIPVGYALDGMTYVSEQILGHPYMLGRSLAHEVLHSWWGGGVGIDYGSGNWGEGLTTYQADHALAEDRDPDVAKAMRREWLAALSSLPAADDKPLRGFRSSAHDRDQSVGYGKSAMVFHTLRQSLGNPAFAEGLRRFWQDNEGETAGWTDLQNAFEAETGRDLGPFFTQWLDRTGLPAISLEAAGMEAVGEDYLVTVHLSQTGEPYAITLPVLIETVAGETRHTLVLDRESQTFEIIVPDQPLSVAVDPDFEALRRLAEGELPPTMRDVARADRAALIVGPGGEAAADSLVSALFGPDAKLPHLEAGQEIPASDALIAVGGTDEIISLRVDHFEGAAPEIAREGGIRAWVEKDGSGRLWLFASADAPESMSGALSFLQYYITESFVTLEPGGRAVSGRWPVEDSPLQARL